MKRRGGEHMSNDDVQSQRRIVRRKFHRSLSPVELESKRLRQMREDKDLYDKYTQRSHNDDYPMDHQRQKSSSDIADGKGNKAYSDRQHVDYSTPHFHEKESRSRDVHMPSGHRDSGHMTPPSNQQSPCPPPGSSEAFDYSLRVGNIDYSMNDNQVRANLFREFKRFGYVNIKVIGYGKERHAYINFNRAADAKAACEGMQGFTLHGRQLDVGWSRLTLNRFPDLLTQKFHEPRGSKKRHEEESFGKFPVNDREQFPSSSSKTVRDISYRNNSSSSRSAPRPPPVEKPVAVLDPNATRTLFVGNLEMDITERELRDIFSPYGRIESVDVKTTRTTAYSFVKFVTISDAINAKNELHGRQYGELRLSIGFGKGTPAAKVWIGNITCHADVSEIRKELDRFGLIRRVDYVNDDNHCFVHFDGLDAAEAAVASLRNYRFKRTNKPLRIDLMQHLPHRDLNSHGGSGKFDNLQVEVSGYNIGRTRSRNDDGGGSRYRSRAAEFHKQSAMRGSYKPRERGGGRIMSEGSTNSPQYTTEKFRHSYNRKRDRSPHMHNDKAHEFNGDSRSKRSKNGFDAYEYNKMHKRDKQAPNQPGRPRLNTTDEGRHRDMDNRERKSPREDSNHKNEEKNEGHGGGLDIPPPPPTIPTETYDTALNLSSSEVPAGGGKMTKAESAETLGDLAKLYPMAWRGNLVLKNTGFPTRMHLIGGDPAVVEMLVRCREGKEDASSLRITQRLRLEPPRLDEVNKRMASAGPSGHCILIALPGPTPSQSSSPDHSSNGLDSTGLPNMQLRPLRSLVSYLKQKEAAGIVALNASGDRNIGGDLSDILDKDNIGVLHAFPPCEFSHGQLLKVVPNLGPEPAKEDHIVVLLVKGTV